MKASGRNLFPRGDQVIHHIGTTWFVNVPVLHWFAFSCCLRMLGLLGVSWKLPETSCKPWLFPVFPHVSAVLTCIPKAALIYHPLWLFNCSWSTVSGGSERWTLTQRCPRCFSMWAVQTEIGKRWSCRQTTMSWPNIWTWRLLGRVSLSSSALGSINLVLVAINSFSSNLEEYIFTFTGYFDISTWFGGNCCHSHTRLLLEVQLSMYKSFITRASRQARKGPKIGGHILDLVGKGVEVAFDDLGPRFPAHARAS